MKKFFFSICLMVLLTIPTFSRPVSDSSLLKIIDVVSNNSSLNGEKPKSTYVQSLDMRDRPACKVQLIKLTSDWKNLSRIAADVKIPYQFSENMSIMNLIAIFDVDEKSTPYKVKSDWKHSYSSALFAGLGAEIQEVRAETKYSLSTSVGVWQQTQDSAEYFKQISVAACKLSALIDLPISSKSGITLRTDVLAAYSKILSPSGSLMFNQYLTKEVGYQSLLLSAGIVAENLIIKGENNYLWGPVIKAKVVSEQEINFLFTLGYHPEIRNIFFGISAGL